MITTTYSSDTTNGPELVSFILTWMIWLHGLRKEKIENVEGFQMEKKFRSWILYHNE